MWSKIVFLVGLLIIQNALGDVAETLNVYDLIWRKCGKGNLEGVKRLAAEFGIKEVVETRDHDGLTCLLAASSNGDHPDLVFYLLQNGANQTVISENGVNSLTWASIFCRLPNVKILLDHGAYAKEDKAEALYELGCWKDNGKQREMTRLLLQHCADPDAEDPRWERTPFMNAVFEGKIGAIIEMAMWKETVNVTKEDVHPDIRKHFDIILKVIEEGQKEREMLRGPAKADREELRQRVNTAGESLMPQASCTKALHELLTIAKNHASEEEVIALEQAAFGCGGKNVCSPLMSPIAQ